VAIAAAPQDILSLTLGSALARAAHTDLRSAPTKDAS